MKIFKRKTWGTVMIIIGIIIFLFVIYDTLRPYFPRRAPYAYLDGLEEAYQSVRGWFTDTPPSSRDVPPTFRTQRPYQSHQQTVAGQFPISSTIKPMGQQNLWVWEVLPERKNGKKVKVEIAHAAPGKEGGFFIVAYADTNNDGKPDQEIAKSPFLIARNIKDWSVWEFETGEERIFVGNIWPVDNNTILYRAQGNWPDQVPLKGRFYYKIDPNHPEKTRSAGPAYTNLKLSFSN